jgi:hypothetical protein
MSREEALQIEKMKTKQEILDGFIMVCKKGTSHDCSVYVSEARNRGVTYEELCEYKRKRQNTYL